MKKNTKILFISCGGFLILVIVFLSFFFIKSTARSSRIKKWNKEKIGELKEMSEQGQSFPVFTDGSDIFFNNNFDIPVFSSSYDKFYEKYGHKFQFPYNLSDNFYPFMINNNVVFMITDNLNKKIVLADIKNNRCLLEQPVTNLFSVSFPVVNSDSITFYYIEGFDNLTGNKVDYYLNKVEISDSKSVMSKVCRLDIPVLLRPYKSNGMINFFQVSEKNKMIYLPVGSYDIKSHESFIQMYSFTGRFAGDLFEGHFIIPNNDNENDIFYLKEVPDEYLDFGKNDFNSNSVCQHFWLMKNGDFVSMIDNPVLYGYFLNDNEIFFTNNEGRGFENFIYNLNNELWKSCSIKLSQGRDFIFVNFLAGK